uniref:Uncharacterized protein n=1 Tax=Timema douglasi TaxID=61478 RepID=A0A7R8VM94_TIMDO|nr:unnamed protein product [Timema douglasi]
MHVMCMLFQVLSEKSQKTSSNQSTKFHQIQQMFGNNRAGQANILDNEDYIKSSNSFADEHEELLVDSPKTEYQLQRAYSRQCEELKLLRKQLTNRDRRIRELEEQVSKLQQRKHIK